MPRARLQTSDGRTTEWHSKTLRAYQRRTLTADALIAGAYLAGTEYAPGAARSGSTVPRGGEQGHREPGLAQDQKRLGGMERPLARRRARPRLILDGTAVRVRLDRKATSISLLVVIGVREDGQKVMLAVKNMGGEFAEAWRSVLDDLIDRGLRRPAFLVVDGAPDWRRRLHRVGGRTGPAVHRSQASQSARARAGALHEEVTADYTDMIYAATRRRSGAPQAFIRKWRLKHRSVADSLEEAGDRLFSFTRLPPTQWRARAPPTRSSGCTRSSNVVSRLRRFCRRRRLPPCCSGRCSPRVRSTCARSTAGRASPRKFIPQPIDLAA